MSAVSGWVEKGSRKGKWKKKFVVQQANFLLIFDRPPEPGKNQKRKKEIELTGAIVVQRNDVGRKFTFAVIPKEKNAKEVYISSPDEFAMKNLMASIARASTPKAHPKQHTIQEKKSVNPYMPKPQDQPQNPYQTNNNNNNNNKKPPPNVQAPSSPSAPLQSSPQPQHSPQYNIQPQIYSPPQQQQVMMMPQQQMMMNPQMMTNPQMVYPQQQVMMMPQQQMMTNPQMMMPQQQVMMMPQQQMMTNPQMIMLNPQQQMMYNQQQMMMNSQQQMMYNQPQIMMINPQMMNNQQMNQQQMMGINKTNSYSSNISAMPSVPTELPSSSSGAPSAPKYVDYGV